MIENIIKFTKYPWASQCLEMKHTSAQRYWGYSPNEFIHCIRNGEFRYALSRSASIGSWEDSAQGREYWKDIYESYFVL